RNTFTQRFTLFLSPLRSAPSASLRLIPTLVPFVRLWLTPSSLLGVLGVLAFNPYPPTPIPSSPPFPPLPSRRFFVRMGCLLQLSLRSNPAHAIRTEHRRRAPPAPARHLPPATPCAAHQQHG